MKSHPFDQLGKPAQRALATAGIKTLEQLSEVTEQEFRQLHGVGNHALRIIRAALLEHELSFAPPKAG